MARVYLETSFFSACVSECTSDKSIGWRASSLEWWNDRRQAHELFISDEVISELSAPDHRRRDAALEMMRGLTLLEITPVVVLFAESLVSQKVMPGPAIGGDALHVSLATLNQMDFLLSWNVKHLANPNKRTHLAAVCLKLGLAAPVIVTPDML